MTDFRKESDSLGVVEVPADKLWGAQTQRSLEHFSIGKDFVASLDDQLISRVVEPSALVVGRRGAFLQNCISCDHFAGYQIGANAEMLERSLGLRPPQLVCGHLDHAEAVTFLTEIRHVHSPCFLVSYDVRAIRLPIRCDQKGPVGPVVATGSAAAG